VFIVPVVVVQVFVIFFVFAPLAFPFWRFGAFLVSPCPRPLAAATTAVVNKNTSSAIAGELNYPKIVQKIENLGMLILARERSC
jgi:hypothetical protein